MSARESRPNLLLVVLDTLSASGAGLGRSPATMPALESIAETGLFFSHAVSNAPWTYPSHASMFTGWLPSRHRMEDRRHGLAWGQMDRILRVLGGGIGPRTDERLAERWLPAQLSRAGYETVAVSNNPWVGRLGQMDFGFDRMRDTSMANWLPRLRLPRRPRRLRPYAHAGYLAYRVVRGKGDMLAREAVTTAREWVETRDLSRPYFMFVNLIEAHYPYMTPLANRAVRACGAGPVSAFKAMRLLNPRQMVSFNLTSGSAMHGDGSLRLLRSLHHHAASYLDGLIQELVRPVPGDHRGTVLCVTSDHGESFGEHGALAHMFTLDEPALHVPLVLAGDGVPVAEPGHTVELCQVYATLLDAAGIRPVDAAPSLLGHGPRDVIAERDAIDLPTWAPVDGERARERTGRMRSVYRDPWKLVSTAQGPRLYDLSGDAGEAQDVSPVRPDLVSSLQAALPPWPQPQEASPPHGGMERETGPSELSDRERAEIEDQLAALGYLE